MRISTLTYFTASLPSMQDNQAQISRLSQQISTGLNMLAPKDDPIAAGQAMQLSNRVAVRDQYISNQQQAGQALNYENTVLQGIDSTLTGARALLVGSNGTDTQTVRDQNAATISGMYAQLKDLVNSRDTNGHYIFAGYNSNLSLANPPFQHTQVYPTIGTSGSTTYVGTPYVSLTSPQGVRSITVDDGRTVQVSDNMDTVMRSGGGNGVDVLQTLDQIAITLHDTSLTSSQVQSAMTAAINAITTTLTNLGGVEQRVASAQLQLQDVGKTSQSLQLADQNALSDLTQVDKASAIIEMQSRQTSLQAAQQAYAQTSKLSLFSYL
jgi:flagellar hook-associated protein 3 FlgL